MIISRKKKLFLGIFICFIHISCLYAQNHTVYLIGDAGNDPRPGKVLKVLQKHIESDSNSTLVFLGDNCYPQGINANELQNVDYPYAHPVAANLVSQLTILKKYDGNVFMVPGNHDWKAQKKRNAIQSIKNEEIVINKYISDSTQVKNSRTHQPVFIWGGEGNKNLEENFDLTSSLSLIMFDSQYYFQKIKGINRKQKVEKINQLIHHLDSLVFQKEKEGKKIIIASHHPLFTNGSHSRFRQPLRFLFNWTPFYLVGKFGVDRWLSQDIDQPFYKVYREKFLTMLEKHKGVYLLAGHDHNLQYITETDDFHMVSGAGSKSNKLRRKTRFKNIFSNDKKKGFVKLSFNESQECKISFISEEDEILFEK